MGTKYAYDVPSWTSDDYWNQFLYWRLYPMPYDKRGVDDNFWALTNMVARKRFLTREYFLNPYSNDNMTFTYDPTDRYESNTAVKIRLGSHGKDLHYGNWREDAHQYPQPYRSNVIRTTFVKVFFDD